MQKKIFFILFAVSIIQSLHAGRAPKVVEIVELKATTIAQHTKLIGSIKAQRESQVQAEVAGVLDAIIAQEGSFVKKGAILAELRNSNERNTLMIARSQAALAKNQYDRAHKLFLSKDISRKELEDAKKEWLSKQQAQEDAQKAASKIIIRAPFDGVCGVFKISEGAYVKATDVIVDFVDTSALKVEFGVPHDLLAQLKVGQTVSVGSQLATIEAVSRTINSNTLMGIARASLRGCENCLVGATVDVSLATNEKANVLTLPREAVFLKDGASHVYVVHKGKSLLKPVRVGLSTSDAVEIVSGLQAGDRVVAKAHQRLHHEGDVKIAS